MTQQTTNYKLQKYEATDKPDLTAQYNASIDTLDTKLKEATDTAWAASGKVDQNTAKLNALGATDASTATTAKTKWDKAATDAAAALQKIESIPTPENMPAGLKAFCTALGLNDSNAANLGTALNHLLNRMPASQNGTYTAKNLSETKVTNEGFVFVPAATGRSTEERR